jgi:hypothetical protein
MQINTAFSIFSRMRRLARHASRESFRLSVARSSRELDDTRLVRREVYGAEKGFISEDQLFDEYDQRAIILNVYSGDEPIATARITDSQSTRLEIFEMHPELEGLVKPERYIEVSRLMARKAFRGEYRTTLPLFQYAARYGLEVQARGTVVSCAKPLIPYYEKIGFRRLSTEPLVHQRLRGLVDYAMIFEPGHHQATAAQKAFWFVVERGVYRRMVAGGEGAR